MGDSRKYPYHTMGGILEFQERGWVFCTGILKAWGGGGCNAVWNFKCKERGGRQESTLNFQRGKMAKASLEIADLMTSPVCKS